MLKVVDSKAEVQESQVYLSSSLAGICNFGHCVRCPNSWMIDIAFEIFKSNGESAFALTECKYVDKAPNLDCIFKYIQVARLNKAPLTFFVSYKVNSNLKIRSIPPITLDTFKKSKKSKMDPEGESKYFEEIEEANNFDINVYMIFYNENGGLAVKTLFEQENPDGIFIIIETNFSVPKI